MRKSQLTLGAIMLLMMLFMVWVIIWSFAQGDMFFA